jgi:o-succinylbenzoate---CoA ligase
MRSSDLPKFRHGDLVAVRLPPGPEWVELVRGIWDAGAAMLAIDHQLDDTAAAELLARARPTRTLDAGGWTRPDGGAPAEGEVVLVVATSGTAGEPKLVQFDRHAIDAAVAASALTLEAGAHDRWLCCLPLAHVGGLLVLLRAVLLGGPVSVHARFDPKAIANEPEVTYTALVPTMLVRLLDAGVDLSRFRAILVGGAALPDELRKRAERAGAAIVETYGLTESCGGVVYDGLPFAGTEVRIDPETHGIELRGPTLMRGYRFDPVGTARAFTSDGWLRPGDTGELDSDGRLRVHGRLDDLINSGGERIWPQEVETVLRDHPKVAEVAVAGRADPEWGQRVVAFVVPADPSDPPALQELRDHAATRISRYKAPRELILLETLPLNRGGKLRRSALPGGPSRE